MHGLVLVEELPARQRHERSVELVSGRYVSTVRVDAGRAADDILRTRHEARTVVLGTHAPARRLGIGVIAYGHLAPHVRTRDQKILYRAQHYAAYKVFGFVVVELVDARAVHHGYAVIEYVVALLLEERSVELRSDVATRRRDAAHVVHAHQLAQRQRVLDELGTQRRILGILDRERYLELTQLGIDLRHRLESDVCVDDLGRSELDLQAVVELVAPQIAVDLEARTFQKEGRGRILGPLVADLYIARNSQMLVEEGLGTAAAGLAAALGQIGLQRGYTGVERLDLSLQRLGLLGIDACEGGCRQRGRDT